MKETSRVQTDVEMIEHFRRKVEQLRSELGKLIVGQNDVVDQLLIALFTGGHCILEGVPGLAKTLMISTLARCVALSFSRVQFTPDLMPSDITGTEIIQEDRSTGTRAFRFMPGPIFANVVLADEINRTPPKTQAALLEAMQEKHVTVGRVRHDLELPFFVLATQNPIEQEGTYPLPEAQQDRFLFKVMIRYPSYDDEFAIAERTTSPQSAAILPVLTREECLQFQQMVLRVPAAADVIHYALRLVRATRPLESESLPMVRKMLTWGAGPRAVQSLLLAGKARAAMFGRSFVSMDDIRVLCRPVLRHRIVPNFSAEAEGITSDHVVDELLKIIDPHRTELDRDRGTSKVLSA